MQMHGTFQSECDVHVQNPHLQSALKDGILEADLHKLLMCREIRLFLILAASIKWHLPAVSTPKALDSS